METKEFGHSAVMDFIKKVEYSAEGIVSKRVLQKEKGNVSLFAFDKDQQLSEHSAPFDALIQVLEGKGRDHHRRKAFRINAGTIHHHACQYSTCGLCN